MDPEKAVSEGNSIDLAGTQIQIVAQDGASDLTADHSLLDQYLRVILPRGVHRARQLFFPRHLADAERRARTSRFHKDGIGKLIGINILARRDDPEIRGSDSRAADDRVRKGFVHTQCGTLDIATRVGDAGELEQALYRAVLAEFAVQNRKHHIQADRFVFPLVQDEQSVHASVW